MNPQQIKNAKLFDQLLAKSDLKAVGKWEYRKLKSDSYMDLSIDRLGNYSDHVHFSMAHNGIQDGDVMADPDMEFKYFFDSTPYIVAMHYQNDYVGAFHTVERGNTTQEDLDSFLGDWLKALLEQGHVVDLTDKANQRNEAED